MNDVGVYVHVPFCERVCPYCDFAVVAARKLAREDEDRYVEALLKELSQRCGDYAGRRLATLYLGGGTPSLLHPESLAKIARAVCEAFPPTDEAIEATLEVNPSTLERERLPGFREAGINRISLGVHRNKTYAEERQTQLDELGFESELVPRTEKRSRFWLDVELLPQITALDLTAAGQMHGKADLTASRCEIVDDREQPGQTLAEASVLR